MYFAALTEVPIIQGLLASGMGKGPALALLLAGPSLSLPNMLVIQGVMGDKENHCLCSFGYHHGNNIGVLYSEISFKFPVYIVKQTRTKIIARVCFVYSNNCFIFVFRKSYLTA